MNLKAEYLKLISTPIRWEVWAENNSLDFIKMVCDERYRIWLKEDFIKVNSGVKQ